MGTRIENETGSKVVNIRKNGGDSTDIIAMYCQVYREHDGQVNEQVLKTKHYSSIKRAEKWARKVLEV